MKSRRPAAGFRLHERFAEALRDVPPDVFHRVFKLLEQLRRDPQSVRQLKGCKKVKGSSAPLFEARVEGGWRIVWMNQPNGEPYLIAIGDHDRIFEKARRISLDSPLDVSAPLGLEDAVAREGGPPPRFAKPQVQLNRPFERVDEALFVYWGVPPELVPVIRSLEDEEELQGLIGQLPDRPIVAMLEYRSSGTIRRAAGEEEATVAEVLVGSDRPTAASDANGELSPLGLTRELLVEIGIPEASISAVLAARSAEELSGLSIPFGATQQLLEAITIPRITGIAADVARDFHADDHRDLEDYYRGSIRQLLLHLHPAQRATVDLPLEAIHFVKGVAGSGKTTVALYRARRILREDPAARVLFLTFNKTLARTAAELAGELMPPEQASRLAVMHLHRWMSEFLRGRRRSIRLASQEERQAAMREALSELQAADGRRSRILDRGADWFLEEISQSIKGRGIQTLDDYLALERTGRAVALADSGRRLVWQAYEQYAALLGDRMDWDDYPIRCLEELERSRAGVDYAHVIVDEAQDLPPTALRLAISLARPDAPSVLLLADAAQSIYRSGFRWRDIGVQMHGTQVHHLRNNYRNTAEILRATNGFLERNPALREDGELGALDDNTPRRGPKPAIVACDGARAEAEAIASRIRWMRERKGVPYGNIAVLAPWKKRVSYIAWLLGERGIPTSLHSDDSFALGSDTVKLSTLHSSKGLEFPVVFVADVNRGVLPRVPDDADEDAVAAAWDGARRLLYVGMTRAMKELYLMTNSKKESPLLAEIPEDAVRHVMTGPSATD